MIGEIRDGETAALAVRAALTGHAVLSTLHTNNAASAVSRLADIGVPPFQISSTLKGVVAQRLVRKLCPHCKRHSTLTPGEAKALSFPVFSKVYRAAGCASCRSTGFKGRTVIAEVLTVDSVLREMIARGRPSSEYHEYACRAGMKTLRESALAKILNGEISPCEAFYGAQEG